MLDLLVVVAIQSGLRCEFLNLEKLDTLEKEALIDHRTSHTVFRFRTIFFRGAISFTTLAPLEETNMAWKSFASGVGMVVILSAAIFVRKSTAKNA